MKRLKLFIRSIKHANIYKCRTFISGEHTNLVATSHPVPKLRYRTLTVCIVIQGENEEKLLCDLDLDRTMPNVNFLRVIFIYYHMLKFNVD